MLYFDIQKNKALLWTIISLISFLILCIYYCFFCYKIWNYKETKNSTRPGISIIIAAHNELDNLKRLIPLLKEQNYPDYEIIVANDRSVDETSNYLLANQVRHINIKETPRNFSNKKYALAQAIEISEKPIIAVTDADCSPLTNDWLFCLSEGFCPGVEMVLGYSPYEKRKGLLNKLIRFDTFQTAMLYFSATLSGIPYMGVGRNMAYRKTLFEKISFKKHKGVLGGDDDLFVRDSANGQNIGIKIEKSAHILSIPKTSYREWFSQKRRHQSVGILYNNLSKMYLGGYQGAILAFYFSMFFSFFLDKHTLYIIIIFILRTLSLLVVYKVVAKRLEDKFPWLMVPILDVLCIGINTIIGFTVLIRKKVTWK